MKITVEKDTVGVQRRSQGADQLMKGWWRVVGHGGETIAYTPDHGTAEDIRKMIVADELDTARKRAALR